MLGLCKLGLRRMMGVEEGGADGVGAGGRVEAAESQGVSVSSIAIMWGDGSSHERVQQQSDRRRAAQISPRASLDFRPEAARSCSSRDASFNAKRRDGTSISSVEFWKFEHYHEKV